MTECKIIEAKKDIDRMSQYQMALLTIDNEIRGECMTTQGIKAEAKDNNTFYFYTEVGGEVENAMTLMGYGCRDYTLSFFQERKQFIDRGTNSSSKG